LEKILALALGKGSFEIGSRHTSGAAAVHVEATFFFFPLPRADVNIPTHRHFEGTKIVEISVVTVVQSEEEAFQTTFPIIQKG